LLTCNTADVKPPPPLANDFSDIKALICTEPINLIPTPLPPANDLSKIKALICTEPVGPDLAPSPAAERAPTIFNHADTENESNTVEPKAGSGVIRAPVKSSPPNRQRIADGQDTPNPAKAPRSDSFDTSGDKLFPKLDDTVTTRKDFNSGGSPAFKLFARQPSFVLERYSADDSSPETETPAGGSMKRKSPAQFSQDLTAGSAKCSRLAAATEIATPASIPGHPHLDTDSTGRPITSFTGLLRAADETPIAKMLTRRKVTASSKLPVPIIGAPTRKSSRLASMDVYTLGP
jgi:hypothetical protein